MLGSRLFWKLMLVYAVLHAALVAALVWAAGGWHREAAYRQVRQRLEETAHWLRIVVPLGDAGGEGGEERVRRLLVELAGGTSLRMTVLDEHGTVIADSHEDATLMENHAQRPEIVSARRAGRGEAIRISGTMERKQWYLALPVGGGQGSGFVRAAADIELLEGQIAAELRRLVWLAVASVLVAAPLVAIVLGRMIRPLIRLSQTASMAVVEESAAQEVRGRDEIARLASALDQLQRVHAWRVGELQESSQRMATVLDSMVEGVLAVGADGLVLLANPASRRMLEIGGESVVGRPLLEVVRNLEIQALVRAALDQPSLPPSEVSLGRPARRTLTVLANRLPGMPCPGVVLALRDVTELRRLESMRRDFVANVSHELKTPLASITAYAETLRLGAVHDPRNNLRFVRRIEEQAERLHQLIVDLLNLSKVESGREVFHFTVFSLDEVVAECIDVVQELAKTSAVRVESGAPAAEVLVWGDRGAVRTILDNLIDNAIKYSPPEGCVVVRWRSAPPWAMLEVEDNGIGISPVDQQRVFERFYRVDRARSREQGGTGLGLSIVKHLCQALGGRVRVASELGKGSTFAVELPLARPAQRPRTAGGEVVSSLYGEERRS